MSLVQVKLYTELLINSSISYALSLGINYYKLPLTMLLVSKWHPLYKIGFLSICFIKPDTQRSWQVQPYNKKLPGPCFIPRDQMNK